MRSFSCSIAKRWGVTVEHYWKLWIGTARRASDFARGVIQPGAEEIKAMKLTDNISISPHAVATLVGEEAVILHLVSGTYFGLDPVGTRIWKLMEEGKPITEICQDMLEEYDVSPEDLERDTIKLLEDFLAQDLITRS